VGSASPADGIAGHAMKKLWGTSVVEYLPPAALLFLSAGFLKTAYGFNGASSAMPVLIGWTMVTLTSLDLITRLRLPLGDMLARALNPSSLKAVHAPAAPFQSLRQLVAVAGIIVFVASMVVVGILPTVSVFMLVALRFGARRGWMFSLIGAAGMSLLVWAMFARLLGLEIFPGLLFDGDW
jgi:hypothetical protein